MVYTLTFNPAVDYYITVDNLKNGEVNRAKDEKITFGGKGINVSFVLNEFGVKSICLGFVGGFTGEALEKHLTQKGINCDFVKVIGNTRINVKLNDTDINAAGPEISLQELEELLHKFDQLQDGDILVLSGSVPKCLSQDGYATVIEQLANKNVKVVVDAEKDLLLNTLKYKPFFIKPNHHELGAIFNVKINTFDDAVYYAQKLQQLGAQNVMVSMGEKGAVLVDQNGNAHTQLAHSGRVISAVGAGDSAVAAFISRYLNGDRFADCLKWAVAAGSATAFCNGLANQKDIEDVFKGA